jgi:hypothetical protein
MMNGYVRYGLAFVRATKRNLNIIKSRDEMFCLNDSSFIVVKSSEGSGEFSLLDGEVTNCLANIIETARVLNLLTIGVFLPFDCWIIRAALSLGFNLDKWGSHCLLFEKKI